MSPHATLARVRAERLTLCQHISHVKTVECPRGGERRFHGLFRTRVPRAAAQGLIHESGPGYVREFAREADVVTLCARFSRVMVICALVVIAAACESAHSADMPQVKGIILLIGDGMGINQVRSASLYAKHVLAKTLAIDSMETRSTTTTYSASSDITDSAAAATALNSGHKTKNGAINVLPDGKRAFTIGLAAKKAGLAVGVLTTARVTDATPAGVFGHVASRGDENTLAEQLTEFLPDVAMGGSLRHFIPQDQPGSKRKDGKNLTDAMKSKGYAYVTNGAELKAIDTAVTSKLFGLFALSVMAYDIDRQHDPALGSQPALADMTRAALSILARNPKGFFVMIEGGRIDHACHSHDIKASICDTLAFDDAVKIALDFQKTHPDVLVLVTADHETGGLGLGRGAEYALDLPALQPITHSLEYLTARIQKQPETLQGILESGGLALTDSERAIVSQYPPETKTSSVLKPSGDLKKFDKYAFPWVGYALGVVESDRAKIGWTSFAHTAQPVITYAVGPGAAEFSGGYDNTDIPKKMAKLLRVTLEPPSAQ
jgi:alkaline phosphatase